MCAALPFFPVAITAAGGHERRGAGRGGRDVLGVGDGGRGGLHRGNLRRGGRRQAGRLLVIRDPLRGFLRGVQVPADHGFLDRADAREVIIHVALDVGRGYRRRLRLGG
jgi:hypothetical protein